MIEDENLKPTAETIENRKAGDALMREAAQKGCGISGAVFELESFAHQAGLGFVTTMVDQDPEDWDDVREF